MTNYQDTEFVEFVVKHLVENPDAIQVERTVDEMGVLIKLTVDPKDMGRVIGKEGRTAKAVRTLLRVIGAKNNARVNLKIMEPDGREVMAGDDEAESKPRRGAHEEPADEPTQPVEEMPEETPAKDEDEEQATEVL